MNKSKIEKRQPEQVTNSEQKADSSQVSPSIANANVGRSSQGVYKFEVGDKVIYDGLVATIEDRSTYAVSNKPCYGLVADEDNEMTCTAGEDECEPYDGKEFDQSDRINQAKFESAVISHRVDRITDKYYRDGCH